MASSSASPPPSRGIGGTLLMIAYAVLAIVATYYLRIDTIGSGVDEALVEIAKAEHFRDYGIDIPLKAEYTGIYWLDFGLSFLVAVFMAGASGIDAGFKIQMAYFLLSFFAVVGVWTVEAYRPRNKGAITSYTAVWAFFYQTVGGAIIVPLYYLAYLWDSRKPAYFSPATRAVSLPTAKSLLPALVVGYLIPTVAMYLPYADNSTTMFTVQFWVATWQPCPIYVNILIFLLSSVISQFGSSSKDPQPATGDFSHLRRLYIVIAVVSTALHFSTVASFLLSTSNDPNFSFYHAFLSFPPDRPAYVLRILRIFQVDFWIIFGASLLYAFQAVWDLNRVGLAKVSLLNTAFLLVIGSLLYGPATSLALTWYWREGKLAAKGAKKA